MTNVVSTIILFCSLITSVVAVIAIVRSGILKVQAPNKEQNARLDLLELDVKNIYAHLDNDNKRIKEIEEGNRVVQLSLLALLGHAIDGNNESELKQSREQLQKYLIER